VKSVPVYGVSNTQGNVILDKETGCLIHQCMVKSGTEIHGLGEFAGRNLLNCC
jgi:hypothetical protein